MGGAFCRWVENLGRRDAAQDGCARIGTKKGRLRQRMNDKQNVLQSLVAVQVGGGGGGGVKRTRGKKSLQEGTLFKPLE